MNIKIKNGLKYKSFIYMITNSLLIKENIYLEINERVKNYKEYNNNSIIEYFNGTHWIQAKVVDIDYDNIPKIYIIKPIKPQIKEEPGFLESIWNCCEVRHLDILKSLSPNIRPINNNVYDNTLPNSICNIKI